MAVSDAPNLLIPATPYVSNPIQALSGLWLNQLFDPTPIINPWDNTQILIPCTGMANNNDVNSMTIVLFTAPVATPQTITYVGQILAGSGVGLAYDEKAVRNSSIYYDGTFLWLFYVAYAASGASSVGVAKSSNGTTWVKQSGPILTGSGNGRNDGGSIVVPSVIAYSGHLEMLYSYDNLPGYRYATAANPTATWTKQGSGDVFNPSVGNAEQHQLLLINGVYVLLFESGSGTQSYKIYSATGATPHGPFLERSSPLLSPSGTVAAWDRYHVATPGAIKLGSTWYMYYCAAGNHDQPYATNTWPLGFSTLTNAANFDFVQVGHSEFATPQFSLRGVFPGSTLVACTRNCASPTISDGANTWVQRSASSDVQVWVASNVAGGDTTIGMTGTPASGTTMMLTVAEIAAGSDVVFDQENHQVQSPGTFNDAPSGAITTTNTAEGLIGWCAVGSSSMGTESALFTTRHRWVDSSNNSMSLATRTTVVTGTYQYDPLVTSATFTRSCIVALKSTAVSPTGLALTAVGTGLLLSWPSTTGAVAYDVFRRTTNHGAATLLSTVSAPTTIYTDASPVNGAFYFIVPTY